jgi:hypothetical protein
MDATPAYLVVPTALEWTGEQLLAVIQPAKATDVNPFAGKLELVVDPRLDAFSSTTWYPSADPHLIDTIEYSYLDGQNGPSIISKEGFEVDGVEMRVGLDYGAACSIGVACTRPLAPDHAACERTSGPRDGVFGKVRLL